MAEQGRTPENDQAVRAIVDFFSIVDTQKKENEMDPKWCENNLEYDLRTTAWVLEKVRNDKDYAEALYSALCNNQFQKLDTFLILKEEMWSCSWRYAGGIIADMLEEGNYLDWYCSGNEGHVRDDVREDLKTLGWIVVPYKE